MEEIARGRIVRADRLGARTLAAAVETRREDASVVEDYEIAGMQEVWEVAEQKVGIVAAGSLQVQHAGGIAGGEGILGDEFVGKMEVEVRNQHGFRL